MTMTGPRIVLATAEVIRSSMETVWTAGRKDGAGSMGEGE